MNQRAGSNTTQHSSKNTPSKKMKEKTFSKTAQERSIKKFLMYLLSEDKAENTRIAYEGAVRNYFKHYDSISIDKLIAYRDILSKTYQPKSVNLKIQGLNRYLDFIGFEDFKLQCVKIQSKSYTENVISLKEYKRLIGHLYSPDNMMWYIAVKLIACTGLRSSELLRLNKEDVSGEYIDVLSKGRRLRRVYLPSTLQEECRRFLKKQADNSLTKLKDPQFLAEPLFLNDKGRPISTKVFSNKLKSAARDCNIPEEVVYPHSFRHLFAREFIKKTPNLSLLADLMGHESIETTRIYLRMTSKEQQAVVEKTVTW